MPTIPTAPVSLRPSAKLDYSEAFLNQRLGVSLSLSHSKVLVEQQSVTHTLSRTTTAADPRPLVVTAIAFAEDPKIGLICIAFYIFYQQFENYVIYPRVMSKSVDVPGAVTVIAALVGAALLGVVGALLAIPTAAAVLMLTREVFVRRQDAR